MSEKEDTISKMETVAKEYAVNNCNGWTMYIPMIESAFLAGIRISKNWQKEHCYTEQEVILIIERVKQKCAVSANMDIYNSEDNSITSTQSLFFGKNHLTINEESILSVDYTDLLKTPPVK